MNPVLRKLTLGFALLTLGACGGGGTSGTQSSSSQSVDSAANSGAAATAGDSPATPNTYTVGGTVTGLSGTGLVLEINGSESGSQSLAVTTNAQ
ncbi:MAG: hypothetical protein WBE91_21605 [Steroidobacteraceae bacterium]